MNMAARFHARAVGWDTTVPHLLDYGQSVCQFPDDTVSDAANYCRNPLSDQHGGPYLIGFWMVLTEVHCNPASRRTPKDPGRAQLDGRYWRIAKPYEK